MLPRYKKVFNDIKNDLFKNLMLVLAIIVGVFSIGTILGSYTVIKRTMADNYLGTNPASATIIMESELLKATLLDSVRQLPGIDQVERHATIKARMKIGDTWHPLLLFVIDDFNSKKTNTFFPEKGKEVPQTGSMLVERTAIEIMKAGLNEQVTVKTANGKKTALVISGVVHDPSLAPARQEQSGYGYITLETLHMLGEKQGFNELRIIFDNKNMNINEATAKAKELAQSLISFGYNIHEVQVPQPREHPHQAPMEAVLSLFIIFSFMVLLLSSVLLAVSVSTLMLRQVREIGIMKTIGAGSGQISVMYIFMILLLSIISVTVAVPLSRLAAPLFYNSVAFLINLEITSSVIPVWVTWIQWISGLFIPLAIALFPVVRGSRIPAKEAMSNYGVSQKGFGKGIIERSLSGMLIFSETVTLSVRNVFRKRSRLVMTLLLLGCAAAMFMTSRNLAKSWDANQDKIYIYRHYDLEVIFNRSLETADIIKGISKIRGVKAVEAWGTSDITVTQDVSFAVAHTYPDQGHGGLFMLASPLNTNLIDLPLEKGSWLKRSNSNDVVLNQLARAYMPKIKIGDTISLSIENKPTQWRVTGFVYDVGSPATVFVSLKTFQKISETGNAANMLRIAFDNRDPEAAKQKTIEVEDWLEQRNIPVIRSVPLGMLHNAMTEHVSVLVNTLLSLAILMGIVGALGLMSALSMSVMERTREIGILRSIGATPRKIRNLLLGEGLLTAALSVILAVIPSWFLSFYMGQLIGDLSFKTPLPFAISNEALVIWLLIITGGSVVALLYPVRRAIKITTREALSYE